MSLCQFYTTSAEHILTDFDEFIDILLSSSSKIIVEPFCGKGDLLFWLKDKIKQHSVNLDDFIIETYDLDPKLDFTIKQDTLESPPDYQDKFIITNPPYLASNKSENKLIYLKENLDDYYKIFIKHLTLNICNTGIIIIPFNFFLGQRTKDIELRNKFFSLYKILKVNVFEEKVFELTDYSICSILFTRGETKDLEFNFYPEKKVMKFNLIEFNNIFEMFEYNTGIKVGRIVIDDREDETTKFTNLHLRAIDTGTMDGRICLYREETLNYGKVSDRTFCQIKINFRKLSKDEEERIVLEFNKIVEEARNKYHSLFLINYRHSAVYQRKRIEFKMAYRIIGKIIEDIIGVCVLEDKLDKIRIS